MQMTARAMAPRRLDAGYCERTTLQDGTPIVLRPIRPEDGPLLQQGLLQLSERTRYLRFHAPRKAFDPEELRFLTHLDGESHFALAALALPSRHLAGVGRFVRSLASPADAELALVVTDSMQGKGLGQMLLSRLREAALERNVSRFIGAVLDENRVMRELLRKFGARVGLASRGVCDIEMALT